MFKPTARSLLLVVALGCAGDGTGPLIPRNAINVDFARIDEVHTTRMSGFDSAQRTAITNQADFESFWGSYNALVDPAPPIPAVDFSASIVIAAGMGIKNSAGYSIDIDRVAESDETLFVEVVSTSPGPDCAIPLAAVLTSPVTAVVVPRADEPVLFVEIEKDLCADRQ